MTLPRKDEDQLAVIWVLLTMKWSWRRIARIQLPKSHHTVKALFDKACEGNELPDSAKMPIFVKGVGGLRIVPVGSTSNLEYVEAESNNRKRGKRIRPKNYNKDLRENSHD